jgi:hypothetical protein
MLRRVQWGAEDEEEDTNNATAACKVRADPSTSLLTFLRIRQGAMDDFYNRP